MVVRDPVRMERSKRSGAIAGARNSGPQFSESL
jgi:hypothetical protein